MAKTALEWPGGKLGPKELLEQGYQKTVRDPSIRAGGTTACVAVADDDGRMLVANLGDSGFVQLRLGTVHHYSNPQTHAFNTPFQISITPPEILRQAALPLNDRPDRADLADHVLRHGDVLVLATDGVWDNLDAQEILRIVTKEMTSAGAWDRTQQGYVVIDNIVLLVEPKDGSERSLQNRIAATIVGEAKSASLDRKRDGPFAKAWKREAYLDPYHGGKADDICVLVVIPVDRTRVAQQNKVKL
jgi:protein phosphatase PTC7